VVLLSRHPSLGDLGEAAAAGLLCSAIPFLSDTLALRRVPARFFGVFMSVNPVVAALAGLVVLGQSLAWVQWLAIAAIVAANAVSVALRPAPRSDRRPGRPARVTAGHGGITG
jgi:inner membrane transporter RhtA